MKKLLAVLGVLGYAVDSLDARVAKRLEEPSRRNDFIASNPTLRTLGQGDVTLDSGMEIGSDVAHYQESKYVVAGSR